MYDGHRKIGGKAVLPRGLEEIKTNLILVGDWVRIECEKLGSSNRYLRMRNRLLLLTPQRLTVFSALASAGEKMGIKIVPFRYKILIPSN